MDSRHARRRHSRHQPAPRDQRRVRRLDDLGSGLAPREKVLHSYELMARYVFSQFQGTVTGLEASVRWASERRTVMQGGRLAGLKQVDQAYYGKDSNQDPARTAGSNPN